MCGIGWMMCDQTKGNVCWGRMWVVGSVVCLVCIGLRSCGRLPMLEGFDGMCARGYMVCLVFD